MSQTAPREDGEIVRDFLSIADILEETQLARIYTHIYHEGGATVGEVIDLSVSRRELPTCM